MDRKLSELIEKLRHMKRVSAEADAAYGRQNAARDAAREVAVRARADAVSLENEILEYVSGLTGGEK